MDYIFRILRGTTLTEKSQMVSTATIDDQAIHVWSLNFSDLSRSWLDDRLSWLSAEEQRTAGRHRFRYAYLAGKLFFRCLLSHYCNLPVHRLPLAYGAYGKPLLQGVDLSFNLSHSRDGAVMAVSRQRRLGIDVEELSRSIDIESIASEYFDEAETRCLDSAADSERPWSFLYLWTLKEAFFKALGSGLSDDISRVRFRLGGGRIAMEVVDGTECPRDWQFALWQNPHSLRGRCSVALAYEGRKSLPVVWFDGSRLMSGAPPEGVTCVPYMLSRAVDDLSRRPEPMVL